jgi:polysaccharide export outer membrane protein
MRAKEPIFTAALISLILASAAAQDAGRTRSGGNTARIGGVDIATPKGETPQPLVALDNYQLGPGDQVSIHVVDLDQIPTTPYRVDATGAIYVPTIGRLQAQGLTAEGLSAAVRERLKRILVDPDVTVSIVEFRSQPVSVLGAVANPGVHQLAGQKTLLEVIVLAGGIRPEAGNSIHITRTLKYGKIPLPDAANDSSGEFSVASVRVKSLMTGADAQDNIEIKPNDVITVPRSQPIYVLGAVVHAGGYMLNENEALTALQIMSLAGGLDKMAAPRQARIMRPVADSTSRTEIAVDLKKILDGKAPDIPLKPNDVLIVPTSGKKAATLRTIETAIGLGTTAAATTIYRY